jgi:hypothetical protein
MRGDGALVRALPGAGNVRRFAEDAPFAASRGSGVIVLREVDTLYASGALVFVSNEGGEIRCWVGVAPFDVSGLLDGRGGGVGGVEGVSVGGRVEGSGDVANVDSENLFRVLDRERDVKLEVLLPRVADEEESIRSTCRGQSRKKERGKEEGRKRKGEKLKERKRRKRTSPPETPS